MTTREIVIAALRIDPAERAAYLSRFGGGNQQLLLEATLLRLGRRQASLEK